MFQPQERPLDWAFRRKAKTHFLRPGNSSPANNSELLFNGSAEARQIVSDAHALVFDGEMIGKTFSSMGILSSVLDYLKGKDLSPERFSYTADFFGPTPEEWLALMATRETVAETPLVQISPSELGKEFLQQLKDKATSVKEIMMPLEDTHSEEYPEWSVQNQESIQSLPWDEEDEQLLAESMQDLDAGVGLDDCDDVPFDLNLDIEGTVKKDGRTR